VGRTLELSRRLKSLFEGFSGNADNKRNPEISSQLHDAPATRPASYSDKQADNFVRKESRKPGNQSAAVFMSTRSNKFWRTHHDGNALHTPSFLG